MLNLTQNRHLDEELMTLRTMLFEMSDLVDEQVAGAIDAVANCDVELARRVRERDDEVDAYELK
ncbi:MAG: PhoU domain-containing protein, partial [Rhodothermales bacterium]